ncbi:hypothetical protein, partial [Olivibacter sp. XZL3]|uniref:hypothetical protein n=1 Tax=Olivibacter sp. XZL3 TaxID=1735116 RepID=UPI0010670173
MPSHQGGGHSADGRWGRFLRAAESERKREGSGVRTAEKGGKNILKNILEKRKKLLPLHSQSEADRPRRGNGRDAREGEKNSDVPEGRPEGCSGGR